ncbi:hypothetical protein FUAX_46320 (plasmid) [Fulvitalea axinellae]|uniref:Type IX secretion system membrane protein PorP/SprF n=1 Tax=Fulvitalea axinellae TaxID=1182444 RepID=A0AAU9CSD3_9BACT|nr:hypothetical protein FUAX_46320 [Fulvitalea axinellae]
MKFFKDYKIRFCTFSSLCLAIVFFSSTTAVAQSSDYYFSLYHQNPQAINPAFSGLGGTSLNTGYRKTVTDFSGSPEMFLMGANVKVGSSETVRGHGLGGFVYSRKAGGFQHAVGGLSYAYHVPLKENLSLSGGAAFYYDRWNLDEEDLRPRDRSDVKYRELLDSDGRSTNYDVQVGVALNGESFYFGYTFSQRLGDVDVADGADALVGYSGHSFDAGYRRPFAGNFTFLGSAHYKVLTHADDSYMLAGRVAYKDVINGGLAYKDGSALALLLGFRTGKKLGISYAYDVPATEKSNVSDGAHEIVLEYRFSGRNMFFW